MNRTPVSRLAFWIGCTLLAVAGLGAMSVAASTARTDRAQPPPNTSVYRIYLPMLVRVPLPTGCVAPPPNMAAWWPLDELAGPTAVDIAGFPTNGTHVNGPTPAPGMVAGGLSFDGANDYVNVLDHPSLNFGQGNLSIDAWIKTSDTGGVKVVVDKRVEAASVRGYSLYLVNGVLAFQLANGVGSPICAPGPTSSCTNWSAGVFVANGQWRHIAVTVERTGTTGGRFYVDGVLVNTFNPTSRLGVADKHEPLAPGQPLVVGHRAVPRDPGRGRAVSTRADAPGGPVHLPGRQLRKVQRHTHAHGDPDTDGYTTHAYTDPTPHATPPRRRPGRPTRSSSSSSTPRG